MSLKLDRFHSFFPLSSFPLPFPTFLCNHHSVLTHLAIAIFQHYWHDSHLFMDCFPQGVLHKKTFFCVKTTELTQPCYSTPFHQLCCFKHIVPENNPAANSKKYSNKLSMKALVEKDILMKKQGEEMRKAPHFFYVHLSFFIL